MTNTTVSIYDNRKRALYTGAELTEGKFNSVSKAKTDLIGASKVVPNQSPEENSVEIE